MAESKSEKTYESIRAIGDVSSYGVFIYDIAAHRFLYVNSAFAQLIEIDEKLLMSDPGVILRSLPELDQRYLSQRFTELLEKGRIEHAQLPVRQNNVQMFFSWDAYLSKNRKVVIGFMQDVTTVREHEDYLINFGARKDAILDMVAQNLSSPLNLSKFTVDLIDKAVKEKKYHKLNAHVRLIREVTSECIRIIDKFLQEEHLQSPDVDVKKNRFDVLQKLSIVLERLKETNPDKTFKETTDVNYVFINSDALKFFQIVHNVYSNAIKFTKPNGIIETIVKEHANSVEIIIRDNGIGIPDDIKPYLFERKTRAARPGLKGEISNGIGLYVVKQLMDMLHGKISYESAENKGTTFVLEFPKD